MGKEPTIIAATGDTWETIAARELGNRTLGDELAGYNGYAGHMAVPVGLEVKLPYRGAAPESAAEKRARLQREIDELPDDPKPATTNGKGAKGKGSPAPDPAGS